MCLQRTKGHSLRRTCRHRDIHHIRRNAKVRVPTAKAREQRGVRVNPLIEGNLTQLALEQEVRRCVGRCVGPGIHAAGALRAHHLDPCAAIPFEVGHRSRFTIVSGTTVLLGRCADRLRPQVRLLESRTFESGTFENSIFETTTGVRPVFPIPTDREGAAGLGERHQRLHDMHQNKQEHAKALEPAPPLMGLFAVYVHHLAEGFERRTGLWNPASPQATY